MAVIGISCDTDSISYIILDGTSEKPKLIECETHYLKQPQKGALLDSAKHRIEAVAEKYKVKKAAFLVVDTTYGKGVNTKTHPVKHQLEGVLMHSFLKKGMSLEK